MSKQLSIEAGVVKRLRELARDERAAALLALLELDEAFGRPHVHVGLGIRKMRERVFECRAGLALRFLFEDRGVDLYVFFLGDHDEIRALIRRMK